MSAASNNFSHTLPIRLFAAHPDVKPLFTSFNIDNDAAMSKHGARFMSQLGCMAEYASEGKDEAMRSTAKMVVRNHFPRGVKDIALYKVLLDA